jgi:replicative DNA helicase
MKQTSINALISAKESIENAMWDFVPKDKNNEKKIIGHLLAQPKDISTIIDTISSEEFYSNTHKEIYKAIIALEIDCKTIDVVSVASELKANGKFDIIGDEAYFNDFSNKLSESSLLDYYVKAIHNDFLKRKLYKVASEIQKQVLDESTEVNSLMHFVESEMFRLSEMNIKSPIRKIDSILSQALEKIEQKAKDFGSNVGVYSGYKELDKITFGWQPSELIIIGSQSSMGKTAFALSMARNIAIENNKAVAIFSLENSALELTNRLISLETEIPTSKIHRGDLQDYEWQKLESRARNIELAPIYIDDTPAISIFELRDKCRRMAREYSRTDIIIIDNLELITASVDRQNNKEQRCSIILRILKELAKELNVPIIALSSLNSSLEEKTQDKRPRLSDFLLSDVIEKFADTVMFIHRSECDNNNNNNDPQDNRLKEVAEIIIAKHYNGETSSLSLNFNKKIAKFEDK